MIYRDIILFLALGLQTVFAVRCENENASRCVLPNGKGNKYIVCENANEVEKTCEGAETCYSNGNTGIMCIDVVALKKRQTSSNSAFGGYEPLLNNFNSGLYGDANKFGNFVTNMRSMMMTDKNALGDVSSSISNGVQSTKSKIASNTKNVGAMFGSTSGLNGLISGAKNFQRSLNQNSAGYSYLVSDAATSAKSNQNNLNGLSSLLSNSYTAAASGVNPNTAIPSGDINRALGNMNLAFNMYYPNTLGRLFTGSMAPSSVAPNIAASSAGNSNATANVFRSLVGKTANGQQFISPFTTAGVQLSNSITGYATPARVSNVLKKYRSVSPSSSNTVNAMNGVANAAISSKGRFRSAIDNSNIAYTMNTSGVDCGCGNSDAFSGLLAILTVLLTSQLIAPSGGCCYPSSASIFARSLMV
ncbi:hypothetical protein BB560_000694 [Smittium megazygosporum]|uniref:Uncharacterized protein n=1 Tax=Smittium megazygosporum TaxID=133381 RepID=A0A2T9ZJN2_9FUNG|nr:hypothetical protein BB560_000694 [Smittium megazygosporum]